MYMQMVSGLLLLNLTGSCLAFLFPPTTAPLFDKPFVVIWNSPITRCQQLKVPLDFSSFHSVTTPQRVPNQNLTLMYHHRTGRYPYFDIYNFTEYNGGIPQKGNLSESLKVAEEEFTQYIPDSPGLAVIDWEEWLPVFDRNSDLRARYKELSVNHAMHCYPTLKKRDATHKARKEFQKAARSLMENTLKLGIATRPKTLWGFYLYPNCYNYDFMNTNYTGMCPPGAIRFSNELSWLWEASTALFPSAYLPASISGSRKAALFVRHQVQEALRVAAMPKRPYTAPIYVYLRSVLRDQNMQYKSEADLFRSIGESAALGAAGCVLWGSSYDFNDKMSCRALSAYLSVTLNRYIANVTFAAELCSDTLCQGNGRCIRKVYDSDDYLHLNFEKVTLRKYAGKYQIKGKPSARELADWANKFTCQCYEDKICEM